MSDDKVPIPNVGLTLDDLLSLEPLHSPPITIKYGGQETEIVLREVPNAHKNMLKAAAIQHVENDRRRREKEGDGEWRDAETDLDVLKAEEQELRILHAAIRNPKTRGPGVSLEVLRHHASSALTDFLGEKYSEFEMGLNPDAASEELIEQLIDDVKKNEDLVSLWTQYGLLTALRSVQYLVAQQKISQTEHSGGTLSENENASTTQRSSE